MPLTAVQLRLDFKCGSGHIAQSKKCHKGVGASNNITQAPTPPSAKPGSSLGRKLAIGAAVAGATALGTGLVIASSRKQIFNAPEAVRRAAQKGVTEVVHRTTSPKPSMKLTSEGFNGMVKDLKKRSFRRKAMLTMEAARRKQEPGYRKPPLQLTAGSMRESSKGGKQRSLLRRVQLTMEAARRKQEPGYRKPTRGAKRKDSLTPLTIRLDNKSPAWQRKEGKNPQGGLNARGIASYRRQNPGSKLSLAVTTDPSKLKPGSERAERRRRFCSRMSGMKQKLTSAAVAKDPDSRINKSLRKWNC
jgi:hypothetical protein